MNANDKIEVGSGDIVQYYELGTEITRRAKELRELRAKRKELGEKIKKYINSEGQAGVSSGDIVIKLQKTSRRKPKKLEQKKEDIEKLISEWDPRSGKTEDMVAKISEALRGVKVESFNLKCKKGK